MFETINNSPEKPHSQNLIDKVCEAIIRRNRYQEAEDQLGTLVGQQERITHNFDSVLRGGAEGTGVEIDDLIDRIHDEFLGMVKSEGNDEVLYEEVYSFMREFLQDTFDGFLVFMQEYYGEETNLFFIISDFLEIADLQYSFEFGENEQDEFWETVMLHMGAMI